MKTQKKRISITIDAAVLTEVQSLAAEANRTLSGYINWTLKAHVAEKRLQLDKE